MRSQLLVSGNPDMINTALHEGEESFMRLPVVAIVGRPNVGKSTLFNRLVGERIAIVEDRPGITRDRLYSRTDWNGRQFHLIDTGGIEFGNNEPIPFSVREQAELAIDEADVIVFVVDIENGVTSLDEEIAQRLMKTRKDVIVAVNKMDHPRRKTDYYDFYSLGFADVIGISSTHGIGTGDLLDAIVAHLPSQQDDPYDEDVIRVSLIGRPNVGKSSLVNAILGEERVIVSDIAGTTRDAIDTTFEAEGITYALIDTAGMRKRGKVYEKTEKYSVLRAMQAIERSDVALVVLDGEQGIIEQDKKIAGYAEEAGVGIVIVVNKWDAVKKDDKTMHRFTQEIRSHFTFIDFAPILFLSAKTGQRVGSVLPLVKQVAENHAMRVATPILNDVLRDAIAVNPPPTDKGRRLRLYYIAQVSVRPPTFVVFVNDRELMHFSYKRFLLNRLREAFGFNGTPLRLFVRNRSSHDKEN